MKFNVCTGLSINLHVAHRQNNVRGRMKRKKLMGRNKLTPRYIGPFEIIKINDNAMRLALPSSMKRIHNVFNVDRLLKHHACKRTTFTSIHTLLNADEVLKLNLY